MVISVQCPSCSTSFPVDTAKVPEGGVYARCSVCSGVFFVEGQRPAVAEVPMASHGSFPSEEPPTEPWSTPAPEPEPWSSTAPSSFEVLTSDEPTPPASGADLDQTVLAEVETLAGGATPETHAVEEPSPSPVESGLGETEVPTVPAPEVASPSAAPPGGFTFGRRDPHDKARRLARVLVSDMIMYNPERHSRAIAAGSLREDFDDEIRKSWEEYVEQVGEEIAKGTSYFDDALNEILARGQRVFP